MQIVFDASTLTLLAKVELLREITKDIKVIIPGKVKTECLSKKGLDAVLISTLIKEKKIEIKKTEATRAVKKMQRDFRIDAGEAEALWLAIRLKCPIAVDDGPTIKACKVMGHRFTTAIHFLLNLAALNRLEVPIAIEKLGRLSILGRYSKKIIEDAGKRLKGGN